MAWKIEVTEAATEDLRRIFRYLFETHRDGFGHSAREARDRAAERVRTIRANAARLATAPHRGTFHEIDGRIYRQLTMERSVYWFSLDEAGQTVRVIGIFHGGQDHLGRMLGRLTGEGGGG